MHEMKDDFQIDMVVWHRSYDCAGNPDADFFPKLKSFAKDSKWQKIITIWTWAGGLSFPNSASLKPFRLK